jgi:hypothetical protein
MDTTSNVDSMRSITKHQSIEAQLSSEEPNINEDEVELNLNLENEDDPNVYEGVCE